jgi:hypothetical protein
MRALLVFLAFLPSAHAADPARIEKIVVGEDSVLIETSQPVEHTAAVYDAPDRIVVSLQGTLIGSGRSSWAGKGRWVKDVRAGQFKTDPPVARVVLDLSRKTKHKINADGRALLVSFGDAPAKPAPVAAAAKAEPQPEPIPAPEAKPEPAPAPVAPSPVQETAEKGIFASHPAITAAGTALSLLLIAALISLVLRRKRLTQVETALEATAKLTTDVEETFRQELYAMSHRLSALEERMTNIEKGGAKGGGDLGIAPDQIKELRTILKSLSDSVQFPRLAR